MVFDLGGGSTEFTLVRRDQEPVFAGLPLGVLSLSRARPLGDPPLPARVAQLKKELRDQLDNFYQEHFRGLIEGSTHPGGHGRVGDHPRRHGPGNDPI